MFEHIIITGGSSGIGLSLAKACIQHNDSRHLRLLTLIARSSEQLAAAKKELETLATLRTEPIKVQIHVLAVDITDYESLSTEVERYLAETGHPPSMLCNVAGTSSAGYMTDTPVTQYEWLMKVNYLGAVYVTKCFLPSMLKSKKQTAILFTSSAAGQLGLVGYSAYSPTKFALRGLAESLSMELTPNTNTSITLCFPPDTQTPGYQREMSAGDKPEELKIISQDGGLYTSDVVARSTLDAILIGRHAVHFGLEGWMLSTLTAGMSPVTTFMDAVCQTILMGVFRLVSLFYLMDYRRIVSNCQRKKGIFHDSKLDANHTKSFEQQKDQVS